MNTKQKYLLMFFITMAPNSSHGMMSNCKQKAAQVAQYAKTAAAYANDQIFARLYKAESVRTAAIRSAMAIHCMADGVCSSGDMAIISLATASVLTALTYNASCDQRCWLLPKNLNIVADAIATVASFDASHLPITGSHLESIIRSVVGGLSTASSAIASIPTSKKEIDEYVKIIKSYIKPKARLL